MVYAVVQKGVGTSTGVSFGAGSTAGTTLIFYFSTASSTAPAVTTTGVSATVRQAFFSLGTSSKWTGIFFVKGADNPGGITGFSTSGITICYFREVSGIPPNPVVNLNSGGNATSGTSFSITPSGGSVAGDFITGVISYSATNSGTARADGWTDTQVMGTLGQTSYNATSTTAASGTLAASGTYDCCAISFSQVDNTGIQNWQAVGTPSNDNVTTGQATMSVTVANLGALLVLYVKTGASANFVTAVSGAGVSNWTQAMTGFTDTNASPHVQQVWIAKAAATGSQTLTLTFSASIGSTGVERIFREFITGDLSAQYSVDTTANRNNTAAAAFITWPKFTPASLNGELFVGFARVPSGSPYRNLTQPGSLTVDANSNPYIYMLNVRDSYQPQLWQGSGTVLSYSSGILLRATIPLSGFSDGDANNIMTANGALGLNGVIAGSSSKASVANGAVVANAVISGSSAPASSGSGALGSVRSVAGSSVPASLATGALSANAVLSGTAQAVSHANGAVIAQAVISGTSATASGASGTVTATAALSGSATSPSLANGAISMTLVATGTSASASSVSGTLSQVMAVAGSSPAASSASGSITAKGVLTGSSPSASAASANVTLLAVASGTAAAISGGTGSVVLNAVISGASVNTSSASGACGLLGVLTGNAASRSSASGGLALIGAVTGVSFAASVASGTVVTVSPLAGFSASVSSGSGNVSITGGAQTYPVAGTAPAVSSAAGSLVLSGVLAGSAQSHSTASGTLGLAGVLAGGSTAVSVASGALSGTLAVAGASATLSGATGSLAGAAPLSGSSSTPSLAAGTVAATLAALGSSLTASLATGSLSGSGTLSGAATASSVASGTLSGLLAASGSSDTPVLAMGWLVAAGGLSGLSINVSGGDGAILPPFVAGAFPPEVVGIVEVEPGPRATISVDYAQALIEVAIVPATLEISGTASSVTVNRITAEVT